MDPAAGLASLRRGSACSRPAPSRRGGCGRPGALSQDPPLDARVRRRRRRDDGLASEPAHGRGPLNMDIRELDDGGAPHVPWRLRPARRPARPGPFPRLALCARWRSQPRARLARLDAAGSMESGAQRFTSLQAGRGGRPGSGGAQPRLSARRAPTARPQGRIRRSNGWHLEVGA